MIPPVAVSIAPRDDRSAARLLRRLGNVPLVELRLDGIRNPDVEKLLRIRRRGLIVTVRSPAEGGILRIPAGQRLETLLRAAGAGAEYVDIGISEGAAAIRSLRKTGAKLIVSHHDFHATPASPGAIYNRIAALKPTLVKLAFKARSLPDAGRSWRFLNAITSGTSRTSRTPAASAGSGRSRVPVSVLSMGEYGISVRILQRAGGGALTYGSFGPPTAPGQPSYAELTRLYRAGSLGRRTHVFGLLGNPVSSSRGIDVHNRFFRTRKLDAVYVNFLADDPGEFFNAFGNRYRGLSVTMPFKRSALPYCTSLDTSASDSGAVNTIIHRGRRHTGYNTDYGAFLRLAGRRLTSSSSILIIGSGGLAATVGAAAASIGASVILAGRNRRALARLGRERRWTTCPLPGIAKLSATMLVNATPAGMADVSDSVLRRAGLYTSAVLKRFGVVYDAVYGGRRATPLVRAARAAGCATITGERHFAVQARLQQELFLKACG